LISKFDRSSLFVAIVRNKTLSKPYSNSRRADNWPVSMAMYSTLHTELYSGWKMRFTGKCSCPTYFYAI